MTLAAENWETHTTDLLADTRVDPADLVLASDHGFAQGYGNHLAIAERLRTIAFALYLNALHPEATCLTANVVPADTGDGYLLVWDLHDRHKHLVFLTPVEAATVDSIIRHLLLADGSARRLAATSTGKGEPMALDQGFEPADPMRLADRVTGAGGDSMAAALRTV